MSLERVILPSQLVTDRNQSLPTTGPRLRYTLRYPRTIHLPSTSVSTTTENALVSAILSGHYLPRCAIVCLKCSMVHVPRSGGGGDGGGCGGFYSPVGLGR